MTIAEADNCRKRLEQEQKENGDPKMSYRSERFNRAMRSLDAMAASRDPSKWPLLSDHGKAADQIRASPESTHCNKWIEDGERERAERLFVAEMRLVDAGLKHLIPVLLLIVDNGSDFHESIGRLAAASKSRNAARKKYFQHRALLLNFFQ